MKDISEDAYMVICRKGLKEMRYIGIKAKRCRT
jgi:hypothetical protein